MDIDKDGYITATELKDYLKNMKIPFGDEEIDEMVEEADTNHDGNILKAFICRDSHELNSR